MFIIGEYMLLLQRVIIIGLLEGGSGGVCES